MATTSVSKRIIRIPYYPTGPYADVRIEMYQKMSTLKLAGTAVFVTISDQMGQEPPTAQLECSLVSANDTTLQGLFAGWEARIFTATGSGGSEIGKILDTEVAVFTQGHA